MFLTYSLGLPREAGREAGVGSCAHKALEIMAAQKLARQEGRPSFFEPELQREFTLDTPPFDLVEAALDHYGKGWPEENRQEAHRHVRFVLEYDGGRYDPRGLDVVAPELFFDLEIKEPWAWYDYRLVAPDGNPTGERVDGFLRVKGTMDLLTRSGPGFLHYIDWKGLPVDTPIPTREGWKAMGELSVGDIVFDEDGVPTHVIGKSSAKVRRCYRVHFDDKTSAVADDEHRWKLTDGSVVSTVNLKAGDKMKVPGALNTGPSDLPIDPYVLGVWLGDGRRRNGEVSCPDDFVFQEMGRRGWVAGPNISGENRCCSRTVYGLTTKLKETGLANNKHIPKRYLRASVEQRLALLRGLMDTDGNVNRVRKQAVFTTCNKQLSDDVRELLLSLGQRPNQSYITRMMFDKEVRVYPIHFRPIGINPFLLPRKSGLVDAEWGGGLSWRRMVTAVEPVGNLETQCIMVDSPGNTYLCTRDMLVTHNTGLRMDWKTKRKKTTADLHNDPQFLLYYYALTRLFPGEEAMFTVFYTREGPFPLSFGKRDVQRALDMLRGWFETIRRDQRPRLAEVSDKDRWVCKRCNYRLTAHPESGKSLCHHYRDRLVEVGMDRLFAEAGSVESLGNYSGGGRTSRVIGTPQE